MTEIPAPIAELASRYDATIFATQRDKARVRLEGAGLHRRDRPHPGFHVAEAQAVGAARARRGGQEADAEVQVVADA